MSVHHDANQGPVVSNMTAEEATRHLVGFCIASIVIVSVVVAAKTYSRHCLAKLPFGWDDFWILPAYSLLMTQSALTIAVAKIEVQWDNTDRVITNIDELRVLLKLVFVSIQLALPCFATTRYSIIALYLRIFCDKHVRRACWVLIIFVTIQYFVLALTSLLVCQPVAYFWDRTIPGGGCMDMDKLLRSFTPPNIIADIFVILIPIPTVWNLNATCLRKCALTSIFGMGAIALVASALRLNAYQKHNFKFFAPQYTNIMFLWVLVEPTFSLIAACLPAMYHLFAAMTPRGLAEWLAQRITASPSNTKLSSLSQSRTCGDGNGAGARAGGGITPKLTRRSCSSRLADEPEGGLIRDELEQNCMAKGENRRCPLKNAAGDQVYKMNDVRTELGLAIIVTTEVTVTQEEQIACVVGF